MPYNPNAPADDEFLADFPAEQRSQQKSIIEDQIVDADKLRGLSPGNASGNVPISNGTRNVNLNADLLDGKEAVEFADATHTHSVATTNDNGFMSNTDKSKLDGISSGAEVNQNAFANVKVGSTTIQADAKQDTLELTAGTNVTLTPDATNDKVTVAAPNVLPLAGGTMTGAISSRLNATRGTAPSASIYNHPFQIVDNGGNRVGSVYNVYSTDKSTSLSLLVYTGQSTANTYGQLGIGFDSSGNVYTVAPTPATSSNSTNIATTAYVKSNLGSYLPLSGGTVTGTIKTSNYTSMLQTANNSSLRFGGGSSLDNGASMGLYGKSEGNYPGRFYLRAYDGTNSKYLTGDVSGALLWGGKMVFCISGYTEHSFQASGTINANSHVNLGNLLNTPALYSVSMSGTGFANCFVAINGKAVYLHNTSNSAVSGISVTVKYITL